MDGLALSGMGLEAARVAAHARRAQAGGTVDEHDRATALKVAGWWEAAATVYAAALDARLHEGHSQPISFIVGFTDKRCGAKADAEAVLARLRHEHDLLRLFAGSGESAAEVESLMVALLDEVGAETGSNGCVVVP